MSFTGKSVSSFVFIQIGEIPIKNNTEKIIHASKKFTKTPAKIIIACCHEGLFARLYGA
ncbi:MAG: hypothetical protein ACPHY8_06120 [Patescibacteria group bacterium]